MNTIKHTLHSYSYVSQNINIMTSGILYKIKILKEKFVLNLQIPQIKNKFILSKNHINDDFFTPHDERKLTFPYISLAAAPAFDSLHPKI